MNVTQRKYTLERLNAIVNLKLSALVEENDILVKNNNEAYKITFEELQDVLKTHPELVVLTKSLNSDCQGYFNINVTEIRKLLSKPETILDYSRQTYVSEKNKHLQTTVKIKNEDKVLLNDIAERVTKLQFRATWAKDQVMLGDAKEALKALEDFNSLVF